MEGGRDWWQQIEQALETVQFMVLIATPNAMQSEVVAKEWHTARQLGVCVYPVQVPDAPIDFNSLPRWMRLCYEFQRNLRNFPRNSQFQIPI